MGGQFWTTDVPFVEFLKQLTLLIPSDTKLINPPIWYMYVEAKMVFIMPLFGVCLSRLGITRCCVLLIGIILLVPSNIL